MTRTVLHGHGVVWPGKLRDRRLRQIEYSRRHQSQIIGTHGRDEIITRDIRGPEERKACLSEPPQTPLCLYHTDTRTRSYSIILVFTSVRPRITKRMQRLGISTTSIPKRSIGLALNKAAPRVPAYLRCDDLPRSTCSLGYGSEK